MKALPVDSVIQPTDWEDLHPADRILILQWYKESFHAGIYRTITKSAYEHLCYCVTKGAEFNPRVPWNTLMPRVQDHFAHTREIIEQIDLAILAEQRDLATKPDASWEALDDGEEVEGGDTE